jgi:Arc/MetJ family transcription regulator
MARTITSIKLNARLVDEAATILGTKSGAETVRTALQEIVALRRFKKLMKKHAGKFKFAGYDR